MTDVVIKQNILEFCCKTNWVSNVRHMASSSRRARAQDEGGSNSLGFCFYDGINKNEKSFTTHDKPERFIRVFRYLCSQPPLKKSRALTAAATSWVTLYYGEQDARLIAPMYELQTTPNLDSNVVKSQADEKRTVR